MNRHPYRLRGMRFIIEAEGFSSPHTEAEAVRFFKRYLSRDIATTVAAAKVIARGYLAEPVDVAAERSTLNAEMRAHHKWPNPFPVLRLTYVGEGGQ